MSFDAYTTAGLNLFQPLAIVSPRAPTTSDTISPNGNNYLLGQDWVNTATPGSPIFYKYGGGGVWLVI